MQFNNKTNKRRPHLVALLTGDAKLLHVGAGVNHSLDFVLSCLQITKFFKPVIQIRIRLLRLKSK